MRWAASALLNSNASFFVQEPARLSRSWYSFIPGFLFLRASLFRSSRLMTALLMLARWRSAATWLARSPPVLLRRPCFLLFLKTGNVFVANVPHQDRFQSSSAYHSRIVLAEKSWPIPVSTPIQVGAGRRRNISPMCSLDGSPRHLLILPTQSTPKYSPINPLPSGTLKPRSNTSQKNR